MKDLAGLCIVIVFISFILYVASAKSIGADVSEMRKYDGYLVTNMSEENWLWDNTVKIKKDTVNVTLFMDDIIFQKLSVGKRIDFDKLNR